MIHRQVNWARICAIWWYHNALQRSCIFLLRKFPAGRRTRNSHRSLFESNRYLEIRNEEVKSCTSCSTWCTHVTVRLLSGQPNADKISTLYITTKRICPYGNEEIDSTRSITVKNLVVSSRAPARPVFYSSILIYWKTYEMKVCTLKLLELWTERVVFFNRSVCSILRYSGSSSAIHAKDSWNLG